MLFTLISPVFFFFLFNVATRNLTLHTHVACILLLLASDASERFLYGHRFCPTMLLNAAVLCSSCTSAARTLRAHSGSQGEGTESGQKVYLEVNLSG